MRAGGRRSSSRMPVVPIEQPRCQTSSGESDIATRCHGQEKTLTELRSGVTGSVPNRGSDRRGREVRMGTLTRCSESRFTLSCKT